MSKYQSGFEPIPQRGVGRCAGRNEEVHKQCRGALPTRKAATMGLRITTLGPPVLTPDQHPYTPANGRCPQPRRHLKHDRASRRVGRPPAAKRAECLADRPNATLRPTAEVRAHKPQCSPLRPGSRSNQPVQTTRDGEWEQRARAREVQPQQPHGFRPPRRLFSQQAGRQYLGLRVAIEVLVALGQHGVRVMSPRASGNRGRI